MIELWLYNKNKHGGYERDVLVEVDTPLPDVYRLGPKTYTVMLNDLGASGFEIQVQDLAFSQVRKIS